MQAAKPIATTTLDPAEIDRFAQLASEWWDANGKFRTLHRIGPARLTFLRDALLRHFGRPPVIPAGRSPVIPEAEPHRSEATEKHSADVEPGAGRIVPSPLVGEGQGGGDCRASKAGNPPTPSPSPQGGGESGRAWAQQAAPAGKPLAGLTILDIGCGGGLVCEPLARLGADVTGIDPAGENVEAARRHAESQGLPIAYRQARAEDTAAEGRMFDAVCCLEVIEHVPDAGAFLQTCASLVRPGGLMLLSTINRTVKAYLLAIVGAEYVLRWLPVGTHQWERFVTPDELGRHLQAAGLAAPMLQGLVYNPIDDTWSLSPDTDVNYFAAAAK